MNWFEELGRAVAEEAGLPEGASIEHQCGSVWVDTDEGTITISGVTCETEED